MKKDRRPCRQCGVPYSHKEFRTCPQCEWNSRVLYRTKNHARINAYQRRWRRRNPDKVWGYAQRWRDYWGAAAWYDDQEAE